VTGAHLPAGTGDDLVVLVDSADAALGVATKLDAHRDGRLHRAVSVVLFDDHGRLLMQRRATGKYHSGGLWSNTCCGHPRPGESVDDAARRRLVDELGIRDCALTPVDQFLYYAELGGGLVEHELDHVVVGRWNGTAAPNPREVSETRWVGREHLLAELAEFPSRYTAWTRSVVHHACRSVQAKPVGTTGTG
jgi:isopentenyl-diphosphate delta-isomerase